jgi:hypothetical protein
LPCHRLPIGRCQAVSCIAGSGTHTRSGPSPGRGSMRLVSSKRRQPASGVGAKAGGSASGAGVASGVVAVVAADCWARASAGSARPAASVPARRKLRRFMEFSR